jgi:hypothetical protein
MKTDWINYNFEEFEREQKAEFTGALAEIALSLKKLKFFSKYQ